jgi:hypothetical protein
LRDEHGSERSDELKMFQKLTEVEGDESEASGVKPVEPNGRSAWRLCELAM